MEIEYTLRPEDFRAFTRYHRQRYNHAPARFVVFAVIGLLTPVFIVLGLSLFVASLAEFLGRKGIDVLGLGAFCGWIGAALAHSWWERSKNRLAWKTKCEDKRDVWATRDIRMVLSPDQLQVISRLSTTTYSWAAVWRIAVARDHVFLYLLTETAIVIPRRAFRDNAHFEEFIALARQYQQRRNEPAQKPTGIITNLPPEATAITRPNAP